MKTLAYALIAKVQSQSDGRKFYAIKRNDKTGQVSCNCPAWIFQRGGQRNACKHIREMDAKELGLNVRIKN